MAKKDQIEAKQPEGNVNAEQSLPETASVGRRLWSFEILHSEDLTPNDRHPLFGLSAQEREKARVAAMGKILANIAIRKATPPSASASAASPANS
ncbi:MAG TPA: hypothetical protein VN688_00830 [Gemmataceae bacterium]|nr:hypothetical protein [Gemmataceae bacterium]